MMDSQHDWLLMRDSKFYIWLVFLLLLREKDQVADKDKDWCRHYNVPSRHGRPGSGDHE
jgi:hypothetical protein